MHLFKTTTALVTLAVLVSPPAFAREMAAVTRLDSRTVELDRGDTAPVSVWISADTQIDEGDQRVAATAKDRKLKLDIPADERRYVILLGENGHTTVVAERVLPLQQGSNFRDVGGYVTRDGKTVRWDKAFRSGAMPLLTDADYALIGQLHIDSVVDLRSIEEREVAPDLVDDHTGAMFIANDYSLKPLMARFGKGNGENMYSGMEKMLVPQFRSLFRRLLADEGAVIYHCSAGQDRTGIATGLLYDVLGVDRETILKDYHLSTELRRPQWEMPQVDPKDYPNNPLVQMYMANKDKPMKAEPLYSPSGASFLAQFFTYLDQTYGGSEGYLKQALGMSDADLAKLRGVMLK
ncbi:tyrosine-protein phosphatase [Novosphingobium album (ex Hu et al. 2023)]|uniref:Tyrosine-protein phosphatase n=1 Tax=Novosphingobium album (ex Hu et al. 2023) TaxID=2930093 RepID=A0ABT0B319_9SPHN|nr:tyrosine-protein phosphatase [Novosphingobium album (ex Hu et al. 2023)]MCJ2179434.1 tyrosine-protein phosphatase [Novosphingobium album (ex Hu et al. 2023)]